MSYKLSSINDRITQDPIQFVQECEEAYNKKIVQAAESIHKNMDRSSIVLLSGPSGSGKTTTAKKITKALHQLGIEAQNVSLDNYFKTVDPKTAPKTPQGEIDFESPDCLDMQLLNTHFKKLDAGEEIRIPHFDFTRQERRTDRYDSLQLGSNEIAIFEGIHALNDCITYELPAAFFMFVSPISNIEDQGGVLISGAQLRLMRRILRDSSYRGTGPEITLKMWSNIMRGERLNILPYKGTANMMIDSFLPYEVSVMKQFIVRFADHVSPKARNFDVFKDILDALAKFGEIDPSAVPSDSVLREFIGGSAFKY